MRSLLLILGVVVSTAILSGSANAQNYPWCAVYDMGDAAYSCSFVTADQCRLSVQGTGGFCMPNNTYRASVPAKYPPRRRYQR